MRFAHALSFASLFMIVTSASSASPVTFTQLSGVTGGSPAGTAVFKADVTVAGLTELQSFSITDSSGGFGGAPGQFSGFDLDAAILSADDITTASAAATLTPAVAIDYTGAIFSPGSQRTPTDPTLFGTGLSGTTVDNSVATLGAFDGDSTTISPDGFLSLGDFGSISFNLGTPLPITSPLFLYIGEVGDNGEVAGSDVVISDEPVETPEPATVALLAAGLAGTGALAWRRRRDVR